MIKFHLLLNMFKSKTSPFEEDIEKATHENNLNEDWALIMHICDNAVNFEDGAKYCLKAIMKRLYHNVPRVVLQTLTLLDACVKNCDRRFILQVASSEFTNEVQKLLPKMHPSAATKLKELLQKWSLEEFKDDPELCIIPSLYYKLKSEGVEFPPVETKKSCPVLCTNPDGVNSQEEEEDIIKAIEISLKDTGKYEIPDEYKNIQIRSSSHSFSEPMKVRALYDFDAAEDNELTIKAGEIIVVLDHSNESWWKGSNHRGEGLFPSNFVTKDLDFKPEEPTVSETAVKNEIDFKMVEDSKIELDEKKIEKVINWLNDTDPTIEMTDPEDMLLLEKQCYGMAPIIEECLHDIDNRLAMLNKVNEEIMSAFDLFHSLSDSIPLSSQPLKYYPIRIPNQHIIQFPHSQVSTLPPDTAFYPTLQTSVPQELHIPVITTIPQSCTQTTPSITSVQSTSMTQDSSKTSVISSTINSVPFQTVSEINQPIQTTITTPTALPFTQASPSCNLNIVGGYCVTPQAIPYPVQCDLNVPQGYIKSPASVANVMTFPYAVPSMRPYFPVQYYYVNSTLPHNAKSTSTSTEEVQPNKQTSVVCTTTTSIPTATTSTPNISMTVASSYSSDLHSLSLASASGDNQVEKQDANPIVQREKTSSELNIKKDL